MNFRRIMNTEKNEIKCADCGHNKGKCECLCCCPISKIGCLTCIGPVLAYRGIKKLLRKVR